MRYPRKHCQWHRGMENRRSVCCYRVSTFHFSLLSVKGFHFTALLHGLKQGNQVWPKGSIDWDDVLLEGLLSGGSMTGCMTLWLFVRSSLWQDAWWCACRATCTWSVSGHGGSYTTDFHPPETSLSAFLLLLDQVDGTGWILHSFPVASITNASHNSSFMYLSVRTWDMSSGRLSRDLALITRITDAPSTWSISPSAGAVKGKTKMFDTLAMIFLGPWSVYDRQSRNFSALDPLCEGPTGSIHRLESLVCLQPKPWCDILENDY